MQCLVHVQDVQTAVLHIPLHSTDPMGVNISGWLAVSFVTDNYNHTSMVLVALPT